MQRDDPLLTEEGGTQRNGGAIGCESRPQRLGDVQVQRRSIQACAGQHFPFRSP